MSYTPLTDNVGAERSQGDAADYLRMREHARNLERHAMELADDIELYRAMNKGCGIYARGLADWRKFEEKCKQEEKARSTAAAMNRRNA